MISNWFRGSPTCQVITHVPALAHFRKDGDELWYVAALHAESPDSPGFRLLERAFAALPIKSVVIEGSSYAQGEFSGEYLAGMLLRDGRGLYQNGERGYAAELASKRNIPVIGGEPSGRETADALLQDGFDSCDVLGIGFICCIPQWSRLGILDSMPVARLFEREMPSIRREHGLESAPSFDYPDLLRWYERRNGEPLDPRRLVDFEPLTPLENGRLGTQRISHSWNMARNRRIALVVNERLKRDRQVLAVFGNGHLACHWRALQAAFGEPKYFGDL